MYVSNKIKYSLKVVGISCLVCLVVLVVLGGCEIGSNSEPSDDATSTASPQATGEGNLGSVDELTELEVAPRGLRLAPGATQALRVTAITRKGKRLDITRADGVSYRSSAEQIVTVHSDGMLSADAGTSTGSEATVEVSYHGLQSQVHVLVLASLEATVQQASDDSIPVVTNPADLAVLVNKTRALPADYIPSDLVYPNLPFASKGKSEKQMLRKPAAEALEKLFAAAQKDGITFTAISGYRSYITQKNLFQYNVNVQGKEQASRLVARPGVSEHQSGLAMDVSSASNKFALDESFADTVEGKWLATHAAEFGFIIRYPKGQENVTGYAYEPWHIRYVGLPLAKEIAKSNLSFEQYYQQVESTPVSS